MAASASSSATPASEGRLLGAAQLKLLSSVGLAGVSNAIAATATNPVDVVKVRMQMAGEGSAAGRVSFFSAATGVLRQDGVPGLYRGLEASLLREMSYSGIRMGLYEPTKEALGAQDPSRTPLALKVLAGGITGAIGSIIANPLDLIKVPTYDHTKHVLINAGYLKEGYVCHFFCCLVAGVVAAAVTSPVDLAKSRVMAQPVDPATGKGTMYRGTFDCLRQVAQKEGLTALFKGFNGQWLRIGPHTTISLMAFEQLRRLAGMNYL